MADTSSSLRKRGGKKDGSSAVPSDDSSPVAALSKPKSEWDYWLAMSVLTFLGFVTRFWRIDYPNEVVFDEVHFGKVGPPSLVLSMAAIALTRPKKGELTSNSTVSS